MLCGRCRQEVEMWGDAAARAEAASLPGWDRLKTVLCSRCGELLPRPDTTGRLLDKLVRLGRTGIAAGTAPILEP